MDGVITTAGAEAVISQQPGSTRISLRERPRQFDPVGEVQPVMPGNAVWADGPRGTCMVCTAPRPVGAAASLVSLLRTLETSKQHCPCCGQLMETITEEISSRIKQYREPTRTGAGSYRSLLLGLPRR